MKSILRIAGITLVALVLAILPADAGQNHNLTSSELSNPAYDYCSGIMGYEYEVVTQPDGSQSGRCHMPDGTVCPDWDFYAGKCGAEYSWCEQQGSKLVSRNDGKDPYAREYAACVDQNGSDIGRVSKLAGIDALAANTIIDLKSFGSRNNPVSPPASSSPLAPASFDWRNYAGENWITSVKNQSSCGSCWAFSAVGLTEAQHNIITENPELDLNLSEQYLVSDCFPGGDCNGGWPEDALEYIRDSGVPDEACYPYTGTDSSCSGRCADYASRLKYVPNAHWSYGYTGSDIKNILSSYGPVGIVFWIGTGEPDEPSGYFDGSNVYRCTNDSGSIGGSSAYNHAVLAVGYDDAGGYYLVKNSWGSSWNGDGYFKLGYDECNVEDTVINWTQSSLPTPNDYYNYLPVIRKPATPPAAFGKTSPTNGAAGQSTNLTLDWGDSSDAEHYQYCYDTAASGSCTGSWTSTGTTSQAGPLSFSSSTTYRWQVKAINGPYTTYANSDTMWTFTTGSGGTITQGFEGGVMPPSGWTRQIINTSYTWKIDSYFPHAGSYYANVFYNENFIPQDEVLFSPSFTTSGGSVTFYSGGNLYWCRETYNNCNLEVWVVKGSWDAGSGDDVLLGLGDSAWTSTWSYALSNFNFTPYVTGGQTIKIGFRYFGDDGAEIMLDDITINY